MAYSTWKNLMESGSKNNKEILISSETKWDIRRGSKMGSKTQVRYNNITDSSFRSTPDRLNGRAQFNQARRGRLNLNGREATPQTTV